MILTDQYTIAFAGTADTFVDPDWTDIVDNFKKLADNVAPKSIGIAAKMACTGVDVDRSANTVIITMVLGAGPNLYHDVGGPAWIVPAGGDQGKGYWLRQNGNDVRLYQIDTLAGLGTSIKTLGSASWVTGDRITMEIDDIQSAPVIRCLRNEAEQLGDDTAVSSYIATGQPGIVADPQNANQRGWYEFGFTGIDQGGFTVADVNGDNIVDHGTGFVVNGDFSVTTITAVTIKQAGAPNAAASFTEADAALTCTALDFHGVNLFAGAATIDVTDGTDTTTTDITLTFDSYQEVVATGLSTKGLFKDAAGNAVGDIAHVPDVPGVVVTLNANGMLANFAPATVHGTLIECFYGDESAHTWEVLNATIYQYSVSGPDWVIPAPWAVQAGIVETYDMAQYATTSGGAITGYVISPAVAGFTVDAGTGEIESDGTQPDGNYFIAVQATDDNGSTTSPMLFVTVGEDALQMRNDRVTSIAQNTATITVDVDDPAGTVYTAVRTSGPYNSGDAADIKSGAGAEWYQDKPAANTVPFYATSMTADTTHYYGIVHSDGVADSSVLAGSFATAAEVPFSPIGKSLVSRP